ncbi:uncharacterized protein LOC132728759 [Ruditapes philippinarum]|uniref:uncharacterized protein LOC132728759 n=1 Tax=Ruditapes philippinarum TaxID=129788 RepID=UPI00295BEFE0|nr:uncharacterized protein LOC132728759 [Ruditapes philippinarum]
MAKIIFVALHLLFYVNARPFKSPDFVSQWFYLQSIPGRERIDVFHHLGEVPDLVQVQVRSISSNNPGFIFPAIGIVPRDDDEIEPRSGIVYLYNEKMVTISAQSKNNHYQGRTIYTENSNYWEGPNNDDSFDCYVRVRAWKTSSMPVPDFQMKNIKIHAACEKGTDCFYEKYHGLKEYPSMVIVRTKLLDVNSEFHGFISDAVGSGMMVYENNPIKRNGYVTYGFDFERFRIWTDSSEYGYVFYGEDGTRITGNFRSGELEILAWRSSSLTPTIKETIQLGVSPGVAFDKDKSIPDLSTTEDIIVNLWVK